MFHIVLVEPEIPPNTGNIIRLCANCGATLHLIKPLGFEFDDRKLRRAGLDYRDMADVFIHDTLQDCLDACGSSRVYACSTKGTVNYADVMYKPGDVLMFGSETRGLRPNILEAMGKDSIIRIPMLKESRSLNLANAVSIIVYEAWRQNGFLNSKKS